MLTSFYSASQNYTGFYQNKCLIPFTLILGSLQKLISLKAVVNCLTQRIKLKEFPQCLKRHQMFSVFIQVDVVCCAALANATTLVHCSKILSNNPISSSDVLPWLGVAMSALPLSVSGDVLVVFFDVMPPIHPLHVFLYSKFVRYLFHVLSKLVPCLSQVSSMFIPSSMFYPSKFHVYSKFHVLSK